MKFYFQILLFSFFYTVLIVKLNFMKSKSLSNSVFHNFLDSILTVPFSFNNQMHLQLIDFI